MRRVTREGCLMGERVTLCSPFETRQDFVFSICLLEGIKPTHCPLNWLQGQRVCARVFCLCNLCRCCSNQCCSFSALCWPLCRCLGTQLRHWLQAAFEDPLSSPNNTQVLDELQVLFQRIERINPGNILSLSTVRKIIGEFTWKPFVNFFSASELNLQDGTQSTKAVYYPPAPHVQAKWSAVASSDADWHDQVQPTLYGLSFTSHSTFHRPSFPCWVTAWCYAI